MNREMKAKPFDSAQGKPFAGIFTPIVTPFTADDTVDEAALRRNVARWMKTPLTGLVVLGSNGEAAQLDDDESRSRRRDRPRAGPGGSAADRRHRPRIHAGDDCRHGRAAAAGADAVLVRTPSFFKAQMTSDVLRRVTTPRSPTPRRSRFSSTT